MSADSLLIVTSSFMGPSSPNRWALEQALAAAGLRASDLTIVPAHEGRAAVRRLRPNCVVVCGDEAARQLVSDWTGTVQERRGYTFDASGVKVLATVDPEIARSQPVPWNVLLVNDLKKARKESHERAIKRPERAVHIVDSRADAKRVAAELKKFSRLAFDIEIYDTNNLSCIGFAGARNSAYVFPARYGEIAFEILRDSRVAKIAQNGQFDLHFLLTRCGVRVANYSDDTMIAWHACYPELAGAQQKLDGTKKSSRRTHKSLAFLASIFTGDAWWKDYEFANDHEMYVLNGRDCCITYDIQEQLDKLIAELEVRDIYEQEISLVWPCVEMQALGVRIEDGLRRMRIEAITERIEGCDVRLDELALPLIQDRLSSLAPEHRRLFESRRVCPCCRNGAGKRDACWACAGFSKKPGKRALEASGLELLPCAVCSGAGEFFSVSFNGGSVEQKRVLLYEILHLPRRYKSIRAKGKKPRSVLSTDEDTLRGLIACTN